MPINSLNDTSPIDRALAQDEQDQIATLLRSTGSDSQPQPAFQQQLASRLRHYALAHPHTSNVGARSIWQRIAGAAIADTKGTAPLLPVEHGTPDGPASGNKRRRGLSWTAVSLVALVLAAGFVLVAALSLLSPQPGTQQAAVATVAAPTQANNNQVGSGGSTTQPNTIAISGAASQSGSGQKDIPTPQPKNAFSVTQPLFTHISNSTSANAQIAWSPNKAILAAVMDNGVVNLYRTDGTLEHMLPLPAGTPNPYLSSVAWSPDGHTLAVVYNTVVEGDINGSAVRLWNSDGSVQHDLPLTEAVYGNLAWSPNSNLLAIGTAHTVQLWNSSGSLAHTLFGISAYLNRLTWSPDGSLLATLDQGEAGNSANLQLWHADGTLFTGLKTNSAAGWPEWSPDSTHLAVPLANALQVYDVKALKAKVPVSSATKLIASPTLMPFLLTWSPDSSLIAWSTGTNARIVHADGTNALVLSGLKNTAFSLAWSPDGRYLAAGEIQMGEEGRMNSIPNQIDIWDRSGKVVTHLSTPDGVFQVAWSPDGAYLAAATTHNDILVWQR